MTGKDALQYLTVAVIGFSIGSAVVQIFWYEGPLDLAKARVREREERLRIRGVVATVQRTSTSTPNQTLQPRGG